MKRLIGILLLVFSTGLHAATQPIVNPTSSTLSHGSTFAFIDVINWQVREGGADNWAQDIPPGSASVPARIIDAPLEWNKGLRFGVGHVFEPVGHDVVLTYTTYHTLATSQAAGLLASSFDGNYWADNTNGASLGPSYRNATLRWQFYYNMLDLDLGHKFILDQWLHLRPYVGLKSASIKQRIFSNWYNPVTPTTFTAATENLRNDFWGIGPSIGLDSTWPVFSRNNQSISLIGNFVGALLYGHWRFDDVYANNTPTTITVYVSSVNGTAPMAGGLLGLQWAKEFARSQLSASIGYEVQAWFNQIQFYSLNGGRFNRTTYIQGADFEVRYNF